MCTLITSNAIAQSKDERVSGFIKSQDINQKMQGICLASAYGITVVSDELIKLVDHKKSEVRKLAIWSLGRLQDKNSTEKLCNRLKKEKKWRLRWQIIDSLTKIGDPRCVPFITECLKDGSPAVRTKAAFALAYFNQPSAGPALLANIDDVSLSPISTDVLYYFEYWYGGSGAASAIALGKLKNKEYTEQLIKRLHGPEKILKCPARPRELSVLRQIYCDAIAEALALTGDENAAAALVNEKFGSPTFGQQLASSLKSAVKQGVKIGVEESRDSYSKQSTKQFGIISPSQNIQDQSKLKVSKNVSVDLSKGMEKKKQIQKSNQDWQKPEYLEAEEEAKYNSAIESLKRMGPNSCQVLIDSLQGLTNPEEIKLAIYLLGYTQNSSCVPVLLRYVQLHSDMEIVKEALASLRFYDSAHVREELMKLLDEKEKSQRTELIIGYFADKQDIRCIPIILKMLKSDNSALKDCSIRTIEKYTIPETDEYLMKAYKKELAFQETEERITIVKILSTRYTKSIITDATVREKIKNFLTTIANNQNELQSIRIICKTAITPVVTTPVEKETQPVITDNLLKERLKSKNTFVKAVKTINEQKRVNFIPNLENFLKKKPTFPKSEKRIYFDYAEARYEMALSLANMDNLCGQKYIIKAAKLACKQSTMASDDSVTTRAMILLSTQQVKNACNTLAKIAKSEKARMFYRKKAIELLVKFPNDKLAFKTLKHLSKHENYEIMGDAMLSLGLMKTENSIKFLGNKLRSDDIKTRISAINGLNVSELEIAIYPLADCVLNDIVADVRQKAENAITEIALAQKK